MKRVSLFIGCFLWGQCSLFAQWPCSMLPDSAHLLVTLRDKPVYEVYRMEYQKGCNVNDTLIKRLLYLLKYEWTPQELEAYYTQDMEQHKKVYQIDKRVNKASNGVDSIKKKIKDSIVGLINQETRKDLEEGHHFGVSANIVLTVGYLDLQQAIPFLRSVVYDSAHYNRWAVELALARMGDKKLQKQIIAECRYDPILEDNSWKDNYMENARKLYYIGTPESVVKLTEWLDTSKFYSATADVEHDSRSAYLVLVDLKYAITNPEFVAMLKDVLYPMGATDPAIILRCKEWILNNKKKITVNRRFSPY